MLPVKAVPPTGRGVFSPSTWHEHREPADHHILIGVQQSRAVQFGGGQLPKRGRGFGGTDRVAWIVIVSPLRHGRDGCTVVAGLLAAEHASPDEVRYRKPIQQITTSLLRHPTAHTLPGLRAFAARTGALA